MINLFSCTIRIVLINNIIEELRKSYYGISGVISFIRPYCFIMQLVRYCHRLVNEGIRGSNLRELMRSSFSTAVAKEFKPSSIRFHPSAGQPWFTTPVKATYIKEGDNFLCLSPEDPSCSVANLPQWVEDNIDALNYYLLHKGGLLLRGFTIPTAKKSEEERKDEDLKGFAASVDSWARKNSASAMDYTAGGSPGRAHLIGQV